MALLARRGGGSSLPWSPPLPIAPQPTPRLSHQHSRFRKAPPCGLRRASLLLPLQFGVRGSGWHMQVGGGASSSTSGSRSADVSTTALSCIVTAASGGGKRTRSGSLGGRVEGHLPLATAHRKGGWEMPSRCTPVGENRRRNSSWCPSHPPASFPSP